MAWVINGVHAIIFTHDAEADRAFLRDVLDLPSVDAGRGWLIFALPPAELGIHPAEGGNEGPALYLMCTDVESTVAKLRERGVESSPVADQGWGRVTMIRVPGGIELGLYEPRHPTALALAARAPT